MRYAFGRDWSHLPLPHIHSEIGDGRVFNLDEIQKIKAGLLPESMDDRWLIYYCEDKLYFHRSWTGMCFYLAHFTETNEGAVLSSIQINRDSDRYDVGSDASEVAQVHGLIDIFLIERNRPYSTRGTAA